MHRHTHTGILVKDKKETNCDKCTNTSEYQRHPGEEEDGRSERAHSLKALLT